MRFLLLAAWIPLAVACGGSGGGGGDDIVPQVEPLQLETAALEPGNVGYGYFMQLEASGGLRPYAWRVSTGGDSLPEGITLQQDGALAGVPRAAVAANVLLIVEDASSAIDVVSVSMEVRDVEISGADVVPPGEAVQFQATGGHANYAFDLASNMSGGSISVTGSYTAGMTPGLDVVRATDQDGFFEELVVSVGDDPFAGFTARWGTTDVWWIDWNVAYDPDPGYANDFDEVLAALGLRHLASTDEEGTEADRVARMFFVRRCLGHLSLYYGNSFEGTALAGGIAISFVGPAGPDSGQTPAPGAIAAPGGQLYNTICVRHGSTGSVVGTAYLDEGNDNVEHNCGTPTGTALGIFANRLLQPYLASFNNSIQSDPVGADDLEGMRAMILGDGPTNPRELEIFEVTDGFARVLAAVLAHEIGHSLGLQHSNPSVGPGDLMNAGLFISPSVTYAFNPTHWALLQQNLPGPSR